MLSCQPCVRCALCTHSCLTVGRTRAIGWGKAACTHLCSTLTDIGHGGSLYHMHMHGRRGMLLAKVDALQLSYWDGWLSFILYITRQLS